MIGVESSAKAVKGVHRKAKVTVEEAANNESDDNDAGSEASGTESEDNGSNSDDAGSEGSCSPEDSKSNSKANPGWADVMQKILKTNKPKRKKTIVLSKAKKLSEVKPKKIAENAPFEIQTQSGEIKKEVLTKIESDEDEDVTTSAKRRKRAAPLGIRVKPSVLERERERALQKIATKGVVQLFNVVRQQQTEIDKKLTEAGPLERKREQVLKTINKQSFLDVLMGGTRSVPLQDTKKSDKLTKSEDDKANKVWSVLQDDFVMGAKLKDWDKKAPEEEDDSTSAEEMDSD